MKYLLVIGDGMADTGLGQLAGKTPLEALALPAFDRVAGGEFGRARTVPEGMPPGSDTAILSIFSYDPREHYTGRSVLEAAGMGVTIRKGELSLRVNLCAVTDEQGVLTIQSHNGGSIHGREAETLMNDLLFDKAFSEKLQAARMRISVTDTFRHVGVIASPLTDTSKLKLTEPHNVLGQGIENHLPRALEGADAESQRIAEDIKDLMLDSYRVLKDHPINIERVKNGQLPANMIWPWGAATAMALPSFTEKFGVQGSVVSAVPLVWGIATLCGLKTPRVAGANGDLDTNYEGKVQAAIDALEAGDDFAAVHIEAPDEMAHAGSLSKKLEAIQNVEYRVVAPLMQKLGEKGWDYRLLLLSDHPTLLTTRTHDGSPVPYAIYDSRHPGEKRKFCEATAAYLPLLKDGTKLMSRLFEQ